MMKLKKFITLFIAALVCGSVSAATADSTATVDSTAAEATSEESIDMGSIIFSHISDAYEWHILTWHGRNKTTDVTIYLPCMVVSKNAGFETFGSRRMLEAMEAEGSFTTAKGTVFKLAPDGTPHAGHLMEMVGGQMKRPVDLSITKNVLALIITSIFLLWIILATASWYRKHDPVNEAPRGIAAVMEPVIMMVHSMAKDNIGADYRRYSPYLCLAFTFIFFNNLVGIVPFFPGGSNLTGNIAVTLTLALFTFFIMIFSGTKHYYKEMLNPDVPGVMKPVMAIIEVFSNLMRPVSLTIRLFANMLAGHIQTIAIVSLIFLMWQVGKVLFGGMTVISVCFGLFLNMLEILISFIQAYVFTILSSLYIGLARAKE
jgi:F-type H+-transporting ATPase subunit a